MVTCVQFYTACSYFSGARTLNKTAVKRNETIYFILFFYDTRANPCNTTVMDTSFFQVCADVQKSCILLQAFACTAIHKLS